MAVLALAELRDGGTADSQGFVLDSSIPQDLTGFSVSNAGDINADGFDDLLIGAPVRSGSLAGTGSAYIVYGKSTGLDDVLLTPGIQAADGLWRTGLNVADHTGLSVSNAGDVNGDGFHDVLIGAPFTDRPGSSGGAQYGVGSSYLLFGGPDPPPQLDELDGSNGAEFQGQLGYDRAGWSVASAGDVNGDGFDDFLVGAPVDHDYDYTGAAGKAYLIYGKGTAFSATSILDIAVAGGGIRFDGLALDDHLGTEVNAVGDLNGDGFDDFAVSAPYADPNSLVGSGSAFVIFGGTSPSQGVNNLDGTNGFRINGQLPYERAGFSLSSAGDFNGDGFEDLLIGAPGDRDDPWNYGDGAYPAGSGRAFVVFGKASGFDATVNVSALDGSGNGFSITGIDGTIGPGADGVDYAGFSVSSAGDVDGDGFADLLVGAPFVDSSGGVAGVGESYLIFGRPEGFTAGLTLATLTDDQGMQFIGDGLYDRSGYSVSAAGDVNGDGFDDVLIGAPSAFPQAGGRTGRSYVVFGQDFRGKSPIVGTEADSDLTGTAGADAIIGGQGDDILRGLGGEDVLRGGQGNDILGVGDLTFRRVDGGRGTDTLRLDGSGMALDLAAVANTRITGIEEIDISGTGANSLAIGSALEVFNLSDTSNQLVVHRDVDDSVDIGSGWTEQTGTTIAGRPYRVYTQGAATLIVENPAPVLDLNGEDDAGTDFSAAFVEDQPAVAIVDVDLTTLDEASLESATVTITNLMDGADEILAVTVGTSGLTTSTATPGTLTISGSASSAVYQDVLRTLTYRNASHGADLTDRVIEVVVNDGTSDSNVANATVSLSAVNDAPVINSTPAPTFTPVPEDTISPIGNTVAVMVTDGMIVDPDGNTVEAIAVVGADSTNGNWQYSVADTWLDLGTVTSTMARLLDSDAKLRFVPNADFAGTTTLRFRAWDQTSGVSGTVHDVSTNGGTTAFSFDVATATLSVLPINDAPVLDPSFDHNLTAIAEDNINSVGDTISSIVNANAITDIDGPVIGGIAITEADNSNGQWQHSVDGSRWLATTGTDTNSLLLAPTWRLRFVPDPDFSGTATVTFRAWDQSSGFSGSPFNTTTSGGITPVSSVEDSISITVNNVDDPPTLNPIASVTLDTTVTSHDIALSGISDGDEDTEALTITAFSNNTALIPDPTVTYTSPGTVGTLTLEPIGGTTGTATITVIVTEDDGASQTRTFLVSIGNDAAVWQNTSSPLDVDDSGFVVPLDVLILINELNNPQFIDSAGRLPLPRPTETPPLPFYDVNGDAHLSPLDVLLVINFLNNQSGSEGEGPILDSTQVPAEQASLFNFSSVDASSTKSVGGDAESDSQLVVPTVPIIVAPSASQSSSTSDSRKDYFAELDESPDDLLLDLTLGFEPFE